MDKRIVVGIILGLIAIVVLIGLVLYFTMDGSAYYTPCMTGVSSYSSIAPTTAPTLATGSNYTDSNLQNVIQTKNAMGWVLLNNYSQPNTNFHLRMYYYDSSGNLNSFYSNANPANYGSHAVWSSNDTTSPVFPGMIVAYANPTSKNKLPESKYMYQIPMNVDVNNSVLQFVLNPDLSVSGSICPAAS